MMGAAVGGVLGHVLPGTTPGVWALIGLAGALGGVTRSPFTAIVFAFELTHDQNSLLALLVAATVAHLVSVLVLKRSILTEKVARRGFHVMREYAVDPLEATFVREVMDTDVFTVGARTASGRRSTPRSPRDRPSDASASTRSSTPRPAWSGFCPGRLVLEARDRPGRRVSEVMIDPVAVAHPDEILRTVADRMADQGLGVLPVVDRTEPDHLDGLITQFDLLQRAPEAPRGGAPCRAGPHLAPRRRPRTGRRRRDSRAGGRLSVQRAIAGFEQDDVGDWVAQLECGHRQHVRHHPPWRERAWVLSAKGREERIGSPLECRACDEEAESDPTGGDPACWVQQVCPACGGLDAHRPLCPDTSAPSGP